MKIGLIGPTYPFRGGISHYTTLLCKTLRKQHEVKFISFVRQYPKFLFPGRGDKDPSQFPVKVGDVDYIIDSLNPLTWFKAARELIRFRPDKVIIPWWVAFWAPQFFTILTLIKARCNARILFLCHNIIEHETSAWKAILTRIVLSRADLIITHSNEETRKVAKMLGDRAKVVTAFLPTYAPLCEDMPPKDEARKHLGVSGKVLLFFGFIRPYKGLDVLLQAMPWVLKREKDVTLLVVGEFWEDKGSYLDLIRTLGIENMVRIIDQYIPNEEIGKYFTAADLVVQPYRSVSGSGVTQLSYGLGRPVVATDVGGLSEVIEDGVNGRLVKPGDIDGLSRAICESLDPAILIGFYRNVTETKEKFSWHRMAEIVSRGNLF